MLILAILVLILALVLLWQANRSQRAIGLPAGRVIYADTRSWGPVEQPLYDAELGLAGKPDYLVETGGQVIPVEVKSSPVTTAPYDAHIFQLAAYCLLVQRHYGKRPAYGILHYPNRTFAIDYTAAAGESAARAAGGDARPGAAQGALPLARIRGPLQPVRFSHNLRPATSVI